MRIAQICRAPILAVKAEWNFRKGNFADAARQWHDIARMCRPNTKGSCGAFGMHWMSRALLIGKEGPSPGSSLAAAEPLEEASKHFSKVKKHSLALKAANGAAYAYASMGLKEKARDSYSLAAHEAGCMGEYKQALKLRELELENATEEYARKPIKERIAELEGIIKKENEKVEKQAERRLRGW